MAARDDLPRSDEPPQDYGDLLRLVASLRAVCPRGPRQQAIRDDHLRKLAVRPPEDERPY